MLVACHRPNRWRRDGRRHRRPATNSNLPHQATGELPAGSPLSPNAFMLLLLLLLLLSAFVDTDAAPPLYKFDRNLLNITTQAINQTAIRLQVRLQETNLERMFLELTHVLVTYQAHVFTSESLALCTGTVSESGRTAAAVLDSTCNASLQWFGYYDDQAELYSDDGLTPAMEQICAPRELRFPLQPYISHYMTGLQSASAYMIRVSIVTNTEDVYLEKRDTCAITTDAGPPQYPPQTDLSSFHLLNDKQSQQSLDSILTLYWRPIPGLLAGNMLTTYNLECYKLTAKNTSDISFTHAGMPRTQGALQVSLDLNYTYHCTLFANNGQPPSTKRSHIIIPKKSHIYPHHLEPEVSPLSSNKYIVQWLDLNETLSSLYPAMNLANSYYTLYWCQPPREQYRCLAIEGLKKTLKNLEEVTISKHQMGNKVFGVSYTAPQAEFSSAISWSNECLFNTLSKPFCDITSVLALPSGTEIVVNWKEKCDPIRALMLGFMFKICDTGIDQLECPSVEGFPAKYNNSINRPILSNLTCYESFVSRNTSLSETRISNLKPARLYTLTMRVEFNNGTNYSSSDYIEERLVNTANPNCRPFRVPPETVVPRMASLMATSIVAFCMLAWLYGQYARYRKATKSLTKVLDKKLDFVSSIESFDLKYLINRSSSHAHTSITSNPTSTVSLGSSGEPSTALCVSEYLPAADDLDKEQLMMLMMMEEEEKRPASVAGCGSDNHSEKLLKITAQDNHEPSCSPLYDVGQADSTTTEIWQDLLEDESDCDDELSIDSHSSFLYQILQQPDPLHDDDDDDDVQHEDDSAKQKNATSYLTSDDNPNEPGNLDIN